DLENQIAILEAFKEAHESKHDKPKKRRISDVDEPARLKRIINWDENEKTVQRRLEKEERKSAYQNQELNSKRQKLNQAYQNGQQLTQAQNTIQRALIHLGVSNLNNLPNMPQN
ncbi:11185_t:CDS:2, partial [Cetraspora pellucida]